ncbi:hypothetical protein AHAS_Ahas19G0126400 [Arachis hypogaea]
MASLENMAVAIQETAESLENQMINGNNENNGEEGPMTLASFMKVRHLTFRGT